MSLPAEVQILPNIKSCLKYTRRVQHLYMCFCGVPNWSMRTLKLRKYDWTVLCPNPLVGSARGLLFDVDIGPSGSTYLKFR